MSYLLENRPSIWLPLYFLPRFHVPLYQDQFAVIHMDPNMLQHAGDAAVMTFTVIVNFTCSLNVTAVTAVQVKAMM